MYRATLVSGCLLLALMSSSTAYGQIRRYRPPAGSPLPTQLDYFRQDVGVLDPYNTFVAPHRRLNQNLQALQAQEDFNTRRTQAEISQIRESAVAPTGTGATFMNYSHYYSRGNTLSRGPRSR